MFCTGQGLQRLGSNCSARRPTAAPPVRSKDPTLNLKPQALKGDDVGKGFGVRARGLGFTSGSRHPRYLLVHGMKEYYPHITPTYTIRPYSLRSHSKYLGIFA